MKLKTRYAVLLGLAIVIAMGLFCRWFDNSQQSVPALSITEQMKAIQRQVGCKVIDAKIGPETTRLVNTAVKRERCNQGYYESLEKMGLRK